MILSNSFGWLVRGAILIASLRSLKKRKLWLSLFIILLIRFIVRNLFLFYILFELRLIPILLIILIWGSQPERLSAGLYFLIYTRLVSIPYIIIVILINDWSFIYKHQLSYSSFLRFLILIPFLVKIPIFGLHFWLPKAHVEARTRGSIILAGVLLKLGRYGIYQIIILIVSITFFLTSSFWLILAITASILTFIQTDVKKLVAYRSVTHITFLIITLSINNKLLLLNCLVMSLAHGWVSIGLFFHLGTSSNVSNTRLSFIIRRENKFHWIRILLGVLLIINAALPPFPSFFTELLSLTSSLSINILPLLFVFYSLLVCYYNTYLFIWTSHIKANENSISFYNIREGLLSISLSFIRRFSLLWLFLL